VPKGFNTPPFRAVKGIKPLSANTTGEATYPVRSAAGCVDFGFGVEINGYTGEGIAAGAQFHFDYAFTKNFSAGLKAAYFNNFDGLSTVEAAALLRGYLSAPGTVRVFVQGEGGMALFLTDAGDNFSFMGGAAAGLRVNTGKVWIEPYIRGGFPFTYGAGISIGF
jgi:hypothetical protein